MFSEDQNIFCIVVDLNIFLKVERTIFKTIVTGEICIVKIFDAL